MRGHPAAQLPAGLAWAVLKGLAVTGVHAESCPCLAEAAPQPLLGRQLGQSEHISFSRKHHLDPGSIPSHPPTPCSQKQRFPWDLGLILVPVNVHIVLYWALLLMCKAEMMAFYCLRRAEEWKHPPIPHQLSSTDALLCVCALPRMLYNS